MRPDPRKRLLQAPFNLDTEAIAWVDRNYDALTHEQRIRQLFTLLSRGDDAAELDRLRRFAPGGVTRAPTFAG